MSGSLLVAFHVELAVLAAIAAVIAVAAVRARPEAAPAAAAIAAVLVLLPSSRSSPEVLVAVALATWGAGARSRYAPLGVLAGAAILAIALAGRPAATIVAFAASAAIVLATWTRADRHLPPRPEALALAAAVALWTCAPDTEEVVAAGAAVGIAAIATARQPLPASAWSPALLVLLWGAAQGFRGRPAGAVSLVAIALAVSTWPVAARAWERMRRTAIGEPRGPAVALAIGAVAAMLLITARSSGLQGELRPAVLLALAPTAAAATTWLVLAWWLDRTGRRS